MLYTRFFLYLQEEEKRVVEFVRHSFDSHAVFSVPWMQRGFKYLLSTPLWCHLLLHSHHQVVFSFSFSCLCLYSWTFIMMKRMARVGVEGAYLCGKTIQFPKTFKGITVIFPEVWFNFTSGLWHYLPFRPHQHSVLLFHLDCLLHLKFFCKFQPLHHECHLMAAFPRNLGQVLFQCKESDLSSHC